VQAVGAALPGSEVLPVDIAIEGVPVCAGGAAVDKDEEALEQAVSASEIEYTITLPGARAGDPGVEVLFSDLSHEYVTINAEYTT
jgi:glutamate N-acetyltransferase/amino-acid N-acetyltransferase